MSAFQITKVRKGIFHIELRKKDCDPVINVSDSIALFLKFEGVIVELYAVLQRIASNHFMQKEISRNVDYSFVLGLTWSICNISQSSCLHFNYFAR